MIVLGLIGGIACGKSTVSQLFKELKAKVFSADQIVHNLLASPEILQQLTQTFGPEILESNSQGQGQISRKKLGSLVFVHEEKLKTLNQLLHPPVLQELEKFLVQCKQEENLLKTPLLVVLDIPLLMETDLHHRCDFLVFIDTPEPHRQKYAQLRGWLSDEIFRREQHQFSLQKKKEISHFILSNSESLESLRQKVFQLNQDIFQRYSEERKRLS